MFHAASFLALNTYKTGDAKEVKNGKYTANNLYDGEPSLWIIVRRGTDLLASAEMDAENSYGYSKLEIEPDARKSNSSRLKVLRMLDQWVKVNAESVYPHPLGVKVPTL